MTMLKGTGDFEENLVEVEYEQCRHCGEDFEVDEDTNDSEYGLECYECKEVLDNASDENLILALTKEFGYGAKDIVDLGNGEFEIGGYEYLVLDEEQMRERLIDYVKDTLWAFNPNFLANVTGVDEEVFQALIDNGNCEGNNEPILSILKVADIRLEVVVDEAVSYDGRGHFLSPYDGQEIMVNTKDDEYYCYKR